MCFNCDGFITNNSKQDQEAQDDHFEVEYQGAIGIVCGWMC